MDAADATMGATPGASVFLPLGAQAAGERPALQAMGNATGRVGLFVGGYFALGLGFGVFRAALAVLGVGLDGSGDRILVFLLAAFFGWGLLLAAERARATELQPLGIVAASGATTFFAVSAASFGAALGFGPRGVVWMVVLVALPISAAVLLWLPHPVLGLNVAVGCIAFVILAPLGDSGRSVAGGKALFLAAILATLAVTVDLRTRSRAGSLLHYSALVALVLAKIILVVELEGAVAPMVLAGLGVAELLVSLVFRRRSWALDGWVTLVLAGFLLLGVSITDAVVGSFGGAIVVAPLVALAWTVQRDGDRLRTTLFAVLPDDWRATFPV
jgi:hypothetical protein